MGNTLKSIRDKLYGKEEIRLLMVGLDAAGKTTILYKLKLGDIVTTIPTIGFNVETIEHRNMNFVTWDVSGRCGIRPLWRHYYQNTNAIIFVVDSNDRERIDQSKYEIHRLVQEDELKDTALLVIANKQDLPNAMSAAELTDKLELNPLKIPWYIQTSCATTGEGLYEGLDWLTSTLASKSAKESAVKPVKETKEVMSKPNHLLSSLYSSVASYFGSAH